MAQNIAQFASLDIDDLQRFFQELWPQFAASTRTTLLAELRPYLSRCAALLTKLEPQLFSTRTTQKQQSSDSLLRPPCSVPSSLSVHREELTPAFQSSSVPTSAQVTTAAPASECTTSSATSLLPLPPTLQQISTVEPASSVTYFLPGLPSDVEKVICATTAESFFHRKGTVSAELYSALCQNVDNLWLNVIEQRLRYLGLYGLQLRLIQRGHGNRFSISPLAAKKSIIDVAVRFNPDVSKERIRLNITNYLDRGKKYWNLKDKFSVGLVVSLAPDHISHYERRLSKFEHEQFISELRRGGANNVVQALETAARQLLDCIDRQYWVWFNRGLNITETSREMGSHHYQSSQRRQPHTAEVNEGDRNNTTRTTLESLLPSPNHYLNVLAYTALSGEAAQSYQPLHPNAPESHVVPNLALTTNPILNDTSRGPFGNDLDVDVNAQTMNGTSYYPEPLPVGCNNASGPFGDDLDVDVNAHTMNGTSYYPEPLPVGCNNASGPFGDDLDVDVNAHTMNGTCYYPEPLPVGCNNGSGSFGSDLDVDVNAQIMNGTFHCPGTLSIGTNTLNSFGADSNIRVNAHSVHDAVYHPNTASLTPISIPFPLETRTN